MTEEVIVRVPKAPARSEDCGLARASSLEVVNGFIDDEVEREVDCAWGSSGEVVLESRRSCTSLLA